MGTSTGVLLRSQTLLGRKVVNERGEDLGQIEEFVFNAEQGCLEYAVLSFGGVFGVGEKFFAVPWDALRIDRAHNDFVVDVAKSTLDERQGFDPDDWPTQPDGAVFPTQARTNGLSAEKSYPPRRDDESHHDEGSEKWNTQP